MLDEEDAVLHAAAEAGQGLVDLAAAGVVDDIVGDEQRVAHGASSARLVDASGMTCARRAAI